MNSCRLGKKHYVLLLATVITFSCEDNDNDPCHQYVLIVNNSDKAIYYASASSSPLVGSNPSLSGNYFKILPYSSKKNIYGGERGCYEDKFARANDTLYYNIYDAELVDSTDWEYIRENDLVLKRFVHTLESMNEANWKITIESE